MRIWLLNQFYPPDEAPTGVMLAGVAGQLAADGHEVVVWCSGGAYGNAQIRGQENAEVRGRRSEVRKSQETGDRGQGTENARDQRSEVRGQENAEVRSRESEVGGSGTGGRGMTNDECRMGESTNPESGARSPSLEVRRVGRAGAGKRLAAKFAGWSGFYLGLAWRLVRGRPRPDLIVAMTTPPFLSVLARVAGWWHGARVAHWVMDLYPDALAAHGMMKERSLAMAVLRGLARFGFGGRGNGPVLVLGPCMARRVAALAGEELDIRWVPLWAGEGKCKAESRQMQS